MYRVQCAWLERSSGGLSSTSGSSAPPAQLSKYESWKPDWAVGVNQRYSERGKSILCRITNGSI
eukprot:5431289-Pleurochrysis_carterae.AAC.1